MDEADRPENSEGDPRPWEENPLLRRDAEPHRGGRLRGVGVAALMLGVAGLACGFPVLLALPLALAAFALAGRDLARMRTGHLDPRGERATRDARYLGCVALLVCAGAVCVWIRRFVELLRDWAE
jgi:hypothetical protein